MKDIVYNAEFRPKRKILGFYFDSLGQIQTVEEGLSETEKLALLQFIASYREAEAARLFKQSREKEIKPEMLA